MSIQLRVSAYDAEIICEAAGDPAFIPKNARRLPPGRKEVQKGEHSDEQRRTLAEH